MSLDTVGVNRSQRGPSIQVASGQRFYVLDPRPEEVCISDIASALSKICRYTGHVRTFYSVAQHSVMCSHLVEPDDALAALLHDAAEAYIGDISRPLKHALHQLAPGILQGIEERIQDAVAERFGTGPLHSRSIKDADNLALATECRDLMATPTKRWPGLPAPLRQTINPTTPAVAEHLFLRRFKELTDAI